MLDVQRIDETCSRVHAGQARAFIERAPRRNHPPSHYPRPFRKSGHAQAAINLGFRVPNTQTLTVKGSNLEAVSAHPRSVYYQGNR